MGLSKNIIIFGVGHYGKNAYWNLKDKYNIVFFVDNNDKIQGTFFDGIQIMPPEELRKQDMSDIDIIVCTRSYMPIGKQIFNLGILDYYVMLEGFLYHTDLTETMMPVELNEDSYFRKKHHEKNVLFVQNAACIRTHKIAQIMKDEGYHVYLLYTMVPPINAYEKYSQIYEKIWGFTSANGILNFVSNSDFDIVHCSNEPDLLVNLLQKSNKLVIADTHDMQSIRSDIGIETLVLEYLANTRSDGNMYVSSTVANIAINKYNIDKRKVFSIENLVIDQVPIIDKFHKISEYDNEIHCVYEGGVVGDNRENHRYFDDMWKAIADEKIHIHFYSPSNIDYCTRLEKISPYFHYEGNLSGAELINEMTKYDCGLALFHSTDSNRLHLEATSINKVYEYINARLPIASAGIVSLGNFVRKYNVGMEIDFTKDIKGQIEDACKINIEPDFLVNNNFTMKSMRKNLVSYYELIKEIE